MDGPKTARPPAALPVDGQGDPNATCSIPPATPNGKARPPAADTSATLLSRLAAPGNRLAYTGAPGDPMLRPRCSQCGHYLSDGTLGGIGRLADGHRGQAWCETCTRRADEAALAAAEVHHGR